jgi:hypothetical protein
MTIMEWWDGLGYYDRRRVLSDHRGYYRKHTHGSTRPPKWKNLAQTQRDIAADRFGKPIPPLISRKGEPYRLYPLIRRHKKERQVKLTKQQESDLRVERMVDLAFMRVA